MFLNQLGQCFSAVLFILNCPIPAGPPLRLSSFKKKLEGECSLLLLHSQSVGSRSDPKTGMLEFQSIKEIKRPVLLFL